MYQYYRAWHYSGPPDWLHSGIVPLTAGTLKAESNYEVKPRILPDYYLVWLTAGRGMLQSGGKNIPIASGDVFFLFPNTVHSYQTDPNDLIEMFWIGFSGGSAKSLMNATGLTPGCPVCAASGKQSVKHSLELLTQIQEEDSVGSYMDACGKLLSVLGKLLPQDTALYRSAIHKLQSPIATIAHNYINTHYSEAISVSELSKQLGVSRTTLTKLFRAELGQSPGEYIQYVRMKHAVTLLSETQLSIHQIAGRVGFADSLYFSKVFSQNYGVPPSRFRELSRSIQTTPF